MHLPEQTLKIYMQYSTYFACNKDLCSALLTNLLGDVFLSFLPHLSLEEGIWEDKQVPKVAKNLSIRCLHLIGCNIFPARMTCAELWCQIVWEHFPQLCVKFQPLRGNWVICFWQHHISKMGYFKCTILFNICTISFLSYYDICIGCTMFT